MSIVIFDGFDLVGDSYLGYGSALGFVNKVQEFPYFISGYVGMVSNAQHMLRAAKGLNDFDAIVEAVDARSREMKGDPDDSASVILLSREVSRFYVVHSGFPMIELERQPYYLGAGDGFSIFNTCKHEFPDQRFAIRCAEMCFASSVASSDPFALPPLTTVQVHPNHYEDLHA